MAQQPTANGVHEPLLNGEGPTSSSEGANVSILSFCNRPKLACHLQGWPVAVWLVTTTVPHRLRTPPNAQQTAAKLGSRASHCLARACRSTRRVICRSSGGDSCSRESHSTYGLTHSAFRCAAVPSSWSGFDSKTRLCEQLVHERVPGHNNVPGHASRCGCWRASCCLLPDGW